MSKSVGELNQVNPDLPETIMVNIPFKLRVKVTKKGKSFPLYMRHVEYVATATDENGEEYEFGGTMGAGYAFQVKSVEDCRYDADVNEIAKAIGKALTDLKLVK